MWIDIGKAALMGVVEGLTEFLPISSTAHLIVVGRWISFTGEAAKTFEVAIQSGALLAALVLFRRTIWDALKKNTRTHFLSTLFLGTVPVVVLGLLLHHKIKSLFSVQSVAFGLLIGAIFMGLVELLFRKAKTQQDQLENITFKQALGAGLAQCLALFPGMSRSGMMISGGAMAGLSYQTAARFSFLVAIPVMFGATGLDLLKSSSALTSHDLLLIAVGFVVSFIFALGSMRVMLKVLSRIGLMPFVIYRIVLAGFLFWAYF